MRTATHVLLAGAELPAAPFVVTVIATPEMVTVDEAVRVSVPGVLEFAVNVHWPEASVVPPLVHVPPSVAGARLPDCSAVTVSPAAATKPFPSPASFHSVTVKLCGSLTGFVAVPGSMEIFASTQVFVSGPEFPLLPSVRRLNVVLPTVSVDDAFTTVTPVTAELSVTEHEPVPPDVVQLGALSEPGPLAIAKLIVVRSSAGANG